MNDEYVTLNIKPLGRDERAAIVESVKRYMREKGYSAELREQRDILRYEATIAQVEAERDAWRIVARYNACFSKPGDIIHDMRMRGDAISPMGRKYWAALELLCPEGQWEAAF